MKMFCLLLLTFGLVSPMARGKHHHLLEQLPMATETQTKESWRMLFWKPEGEAGQLPWVQWPALMILKSTNYATGSTGLSIAQILG